MLLDFGRERAKVLLRERSQQFQGQGKDHLRGSEPREPLLGGERAEHLLGGEGTDHLLGGEPLQSLLKRHLLNGLRDEQGSSRWAVW